MTTPAQLIGIQVPNTIKAPSGFVPARNRLDREYVRSIQRAERERRRLNAELDACTSDEERKQLLAQADANLQNLNLYTPLT